MFNKLYKMVEKELNLMSDLEEKDIKDIFAIKVDEFFESIAPELLKDRKISCNDFIKEVLKKDYDFKQLDNGDCYLEGKLLDQNGITNMAYKIRKDLEFLYKIDVNWKGYKTKKELLQKISSFMANKYQKDKVFDDNVIIIMETLYENDCLKNPKELITEVINDLINGNNLLVPPTIKTYFEADETIKYIEERFNSGSSILNLEVNKILEKFKNKNLDPNIMPQV